MSSPSDTPPLSLLFLWHQHQPVYKDALTHRYTLPWVRLHATKDYYDMAALLDEFPAIKANFNLVPSLLTQLDDYAGGTAQDEFLELSEKPAKQLTAENRQFLLRNFFMAHWEHMVDPHPRYRELLDKRGHLGTEESLTNSQKYFKEQDWRDLQVWFNLSWFDPLWREKDPFIQGLFTKGKNFTEDEKHTLLKKQREICGMIVAKHKELQDRGQIEITTTPFYHPILPLLIDTEVARVAMPHVILPQNRFQHPEDAREQIRLALEDYNRRFGRPAQGMWPSEGSVSDEAARLFMDLGVRWIATDEALLGRSLSVNPLAHEELYQPYRLQSGDKSLHFFFRDHELSDAIGFVYASWDPQEAAKDFMRRLRDIHHRCKERDGDRPREHVVSVILDGENCWEYYKDDGLPFLRALYKQLSEDPTIQTVRASDYLDKVCEQVPILPKVSPGSWINANFAIWIGHSEDNKAWDLLHRTRNHLIHTLQAHPEMKDAPAIQEAWGEIYAAEGSDWCWWYGDDHSSGNDEAFDDLFRKHLMRVYALLGEKIPEDLRFPIKKKRSHSVIQPPADFIHPEIDGRITNYFEWQSAGLYLPKAGSTGTMHQAENIISAIYFGFDIENLYFRLDFNRPLNPEAAKYLAIKMTFSKPENHEITIHLAPQNTLTLNLKRPDQPPDELPPGSYQRILEWALPLNRFHNSNKGPFDLSIALLRDNLEQERWPSHTTLTIPYPSPDVFIENWHI